MTVNRIPTHVRGFDEALSGGLPEGYVTLISGAPGTMMSSFCFSILYQNALQEGRKSAYFTLEQSKDVLLEHMSELGFTDEKAFKHIMVLDMGTVRKNLNFLQARGTWIELFKMYESNLADGIVQLGLHPTSDLYVQRRVRCVKMRSTKHETGYYALAFDEGKFEVTRAVSGG